MGNEKEFTGVWIPAKVVLDEELTWLQKAIYAEIACYKKCFMTNNHIAKLVGCKVRYVSETISLLKRKKYVIDAEESERTKRVLIAYVNVETGTTVLEGIAPQCIPLTHHSATIDNILDKTLDIATSKEERRNAPRRKADAIQPIPLPPFSSKEWIDSLLDSPQPHIRLIGYYFYKYLEHSFPNKKVATAEMVKNLKAAAWLVDNFEKEDITKTLKYCAGKFSDVHWNLATVKKNITYVTAKS